jgi:hypothetical protein
MAEVPPVFRAALRRELDALVAGERPELMIWVQNYGKSGTSLVPQPEAIWDHALTDFLVRADGSSFGTAPLWTVDEFEITDEGVVTLTDLHVL